MNISYKWLQQHIPLTEDITTVANLLTAAGLEVEHIIEVPQIQGGLQNVVIGTVLTCIPHPNAEKLSLTTVDVGQDVMLNIVCGAPNVAAGQRVVVAMVGANLYPEGVEAPITIKKSKIRGEASEGMLCAEDELGLGKSHAGILVLDTTVPNGTPAAKYFDLEADYVLEIGLTPNRGDAASHLGVARDLKAIFNRNFSLKPLLDVSGLPQNHISITIENPVNCQRYAGLLIDGLQVGQSPKWLKDALTTIGVASINNIVDVTNYIMHDIGQPLHAFDAAKIAGNAIIVRDADAGETIATLDGTLRTLKGTELVIADTEKPLCIAGVFGGLDSGVSSTTTKIFLESAFFSGTSVRKTSQLHGLKTDSSFRFERGTDIHNVLAGLLKAAAMIAEVAGGHVASNVTDVYPCPRPLHSINGTYHNINSLLGTDLTQDQISAILTNLDFNLQTEEGYGHGGFDASFTAHVPSFRTEVLTEADLAEEVLRIIGLDNVATPPALSSKFIANHAPIDTEKLQYDVAKQLAALGYSEIINNSLSNGNFSAMIAEDAPSKAVKLANALSEDLATLRQHLVFGGLQTIAYNLNRRQKSLQLFEVGRVYNIAPVKEFNANNPIPPAVGAARYQEEQRLGIWVAADNAAETWESKTAKVTLQSITTTVAQVLAKLGMGKSIILVDSNNPTFDYGLDYTLNGKVVISVGAVSTKILKHFGIKQPVFYADFAWGYLSSKYKPAVVFKALSKYPEVRRDLSLVIPQSISYQQIEKLAQSTERKLLQSINLFDVYMGANLAPDTKSYSVAFTLQDQDSTLTDAQIDKTMEKLSNAFGTQLGAVIRQ